MEFLYPEGWPRPRGYNNAVVSRGRQVHVAGQVGWNPKTETFEAEDFVGQARQALDNIRTLMAEAGARPEHMVRMTWYVTSKADYLADRKGLGEAYRAVMGKNFPAMTAVEVGGLMARGAKLEIEVTAVVPDDD